MNSLIPISTVRVHVHWDQPWFTFVLLFTCSPIKKKWRSSQSLNYYVHVSVQFLQTKEMFAAFAWLFVLTGKDLGTSSPFSISFLSFSNDYQSFAFHVLLVLKKTLSALSLITTLFQKGTSTWLPKVTKRPEGTNRIITVYKINWEERYLKLKHQHTEKNET